MKSFTHLPLEAAFFGVLMFGRKKVPRWFYLMSCFMVAAGTSLSAFWIMLSNSWMQSPVGFTMGPDGVFIPTDWAAIVFSPVAGVRYPHMILAAYLTSAFCVAATGAWHLLRGTFKSDARVMFSMGLGIAAFLVPMQLLFGHLVGDYTHDKQPTKFAAIEARWHDEQPASEVPTACPSGARTQSLCAQYPSSGQPDRVHEFPQKRSRADELSCCRPSAGADPVLCIPYHGRVRPPDARACVVWHAFHDKRGT